jgi:hypothetical protein
VTPFDSLADESRWVAWRNELRGNKLTKVPKSANGRNAKSDDPSTWGTRAEAEAWAAQVVNGLGGGIGYELGDLGGDTHIAGIDLDSCIAQDGSLADWARPFLVATPSYCEISPSGQGLKAFFYCATDDVRQFLELVGITDPSQWGFSRSIPGERSKADHGPGIELYFSGRFFAVTENRWPSQPDKLKFLDWPALERLAALIPSAEAKNAGSGKGGKGGKDNSRSGAAFRKGAALRRAGMSFEEMCTALRTDPETAEWCREKGEVNGQRQLHRIWDRAAGAGSSKINVKAGLRHEAADAALAALAAAATPFYQRDNSLVRVCRTPAKASDGEIVHVPTILPVGSPMLGRAMGMAAHWSKFKANGDAVRIDPPDEVVKQVAEMAGEWPFPPLVGVIGTPTMRPDGTLLTTEGYDPGTGLVLIDALEIPSIPEHPTREDAIAALQLLLDLLDGFPFITDADRSVALSALMTPVLRGALYPAVPLHLITKPTAGTGASYLIDVISMIATGQRAAVLAIAPDPAETEKRLVGAALAGHPIIALDNCSKLLLGDFLCQVTERPLLQVRALGSSKEPRIANTFTVFANGNNLQAGADVVRRTSQCAMDANMERPWMRNFKSDPLAMAQAHRGTYVAAILTIARAHIVANNTNPLPPRPSFEGWSKFVRSPLVWLGRADPDDTIVTVAQEDPVQQRRTEIFGTWAVELGCTQAYRTKELIEQAQQRLNWESALLTIASFERGSSKIDPQRLGKWLRENKNTMAGHYKLTADHTDQQRPRWRMTVYK